MILDRVTITGADDQTDQREMLAISEEYPWCEWGILYSKKHAGSSRFPSYPWLLALDALATDNPTLNLSAHLCGQWVRSMLMGEKTKFGTPFMPEPVYQRAQLNFHGEASPYVFSEFLDCLAVRPTPFQWIFQMDGVNTHLFANALAYGNTRQLSDALPADSIATAAPPIEVVPLFDTSAGTGALPACWPSADYKDGNGRTLPHGYAGGLGPDNIAKQLEQIALAAGDARVWVDMESRVRSDDRLDMDKVRAVLKIAAPFINVEGHGVAQPEDRPVLLREVGRVKRIKR